MFRKFKEVIRKKFWNRERYARHNGVKIGFDCDIQDVHFGSEPYLISIGDHVQITSGVKFFTHGGSWVFRQKHPNLDVFGKIRLGSNIYIGANSLIMPGVKIDDNVIVGAGSVVTKSVPKGAIVAGNPARIIGNINQLENKLLKFNANTKGRSYDEKKQVLEAQDDDSFIQKEYLSSI